MTATIRIWSGQAQAQTDPPRSRKPSKRTSNLVGQPFKGTDFSGRSDYGPFIAAGIPSGRTFHRGRGHQNGGQKPRIWGGTAGVAYDPCYHQACDTYANNNAHALTVNSDAVAFAVLQYAMNTSDVNGVKGKGNFKADPHFSGDYMLSTVAQ